MRALHLVYLRGPGGKKLRYYPTEFEPLIIPWWFSGSDREIILAFYQQVLGDEPLPRVEVDWYRSLVPADRTFLQHVAEKRRSTEHLVVVKVRRQDVDLRDVLTHPDLQPFRHVAVTCDHSLPNETFGRISELTGFVSQTAEELYEEMAAEFSLRDDGPELLTPLVQTLLNPILVVEAYNALIDVQAERVDPDKQRDAVYRRILRKLLDDMEPRDAIALCAFALHGRIGFDQVVHADEQSMQLASLRARMVLRDDQLVRWAQLLEAPEMLNVLRARTQAIAAPSNIPGGTSKVLDWLESTSGKSIKTTTRLKARLEQVEGWLVAGQLSRARNELEELEQDLEHNAARDTYLANFHELVGSLYLQEGRASDAVKAFERSTVVFERIGASDTRLALTLANLGIAFEASGSWPAAERTLRKALRLAESGGCAPFGHGMILQHLGIGLVEHGEWEEGERLLRQSLSLMIEGNAPAWCQMTTLNQLARGLRDHGRWNEAEPIFRESLRLKHAQIDIGISRAITMRELAYGLRTNGRPEEAASMSAQALHLMSNLGPSPLANRVQDLRRYAERLKDERRLDEANELEALAAQIESSN